MIQVNQESLKLLASKYIWWKTPEEAVVTPERVIAQVMNISDYSDVQALVSQAGVEVLREVLTHAEAGQLNVTNSHSYIANDRPGEVHLVYSCQN